MIAISALAAPPFFLSERAPDFINSHVHFVDLADSLLHSRSYSVNSTHEGLVPPGLSVIVASFFLSSSTVAQAGLPVHTWHSMLLIGRSER
jgi:hypothetical protein